MKIAMVLAICVILSSGIYAANAEEPIPKLYFDGGDYTIHSGNHIHIPITIQVENHDHTIFPKVHTIVDNQIIDTIILRQSSSGFFQTFLNINENYKTGIYNLQLEYNGKKSTPITFNVIRENEQQQERILGFGDYIKKDYLPKESFIEVSQDKIEVEFSTVTLQHITGEYDARGMYGKVQLEIEGPKKMINSVRMQESGIFETRLIIDREWPSGTYKVTGAISGKPFAVTEFIIKNFNKDSFLIDESITGKIELETAKSSQFSVLMINGALDGKVMPENIAIKILKDDELIDILYQDVKETGEFESSFVLYDYSSRSNWPEGKYSVEIFSMDDSESYEITSEFQISEKGNVITELEDGIFVTYENIQKILEFEEAVNIEKYNPKEINVFGIIDSYITATPITISVVNQSGKMDEFQVFAKKDGQYSAPVVIDEQWEDGNYDVYVRYGDKLENSLSFKIDGGKDRIQESINEIIIEDKKQVNQEIKKFDIIQKDSKTIEFLQIEFSGSVEKIGKERINVILETPDGSEKINRIWHNDGEFDISIVVENSWEEGKYLLYVFDGDEKKIFGEFHITKEQPEKEPFILSKVLETANPDSVYTKENSLILEKSEVILSRGGAYVNIEGFVNEISREGISLNINDGESIFSKYKVLPKNNGEFFTTILIDESASTGFHELQLMNGQQIIGKSEILIVEPKAIYTKMDSKLLEISQDMFVESNNQIGINIVGLLENYSYEDYDSIKFSVFSPDYTVENIYVDTAK